MILMGLGSGICFSSSSTFCITCPPCARVRGRERVSVSLFYTLVSARTPSHRIHFCRPAKMIHTHAKHIRTLPPLFFSPSFTDDADIHMATLSRATPRAAEAAAWIETCRPAMMRAEDVAMRAEEGVHKRVGAMKAAVGCVASARSTRVNMLLCADGIDERTEACWCTILVASLNVNGGGVSPCIRHLLVQTLTRAYILVHAHTPKKVAS